MKLGVDVFSIRSQGWNAFEYLDYCHRLGVEVVHFSITEPFASLEDPVYLAEVKAYADQLSLDLEVGMLSICPTATIFDPSAGPAVEQTSRMLRMAKALGSATLRCVLGSQADRQSQLPLEAHIQATIETCRAVASLARELGLKLAIENHAGDMQAWELKQLIERAGPDTVGACLDSGNPLWVVEDPMVTLETLAPYVVNSHVRDTAVWSHPNGALVQWVAMGEGSVNIEAWAKKYQALCPGVPFTLEVITGMAPRLLNYMDEEFWAIFPAARAAEFARFERLVRQGVAFTGSMLTAGWDYNQLPPEYRAAMILQQRLDLERSITYCRETLGLGAKK
jgi:sugar phosphate isomerase/epimerase